MTGRMPASVTVSLAAHAGALILFLGFAHEAPKQAQRVVDGVDLLIQPARPRTEEGETKKPAPISTMDFLKMALPSAPRAAAPQALDVKVAERKLAALDAPKLEEARKRDLGPKLAALDLGRERTQAAVIDATPQTRRRAAATLAALPRLEEVGRRRVKDLPQALALEERRREATNLAGLSDIPTQPVTRRQALAAAATLEEAAPVERAPRKGLDSLLPDRLELRPAAAVAPKMETIGQQAPKLERRQTQAATEGPKKSVEIEGPLEKRRVVAYEIPTFPDWAKSTIMEASVSIRFNVGADGEILPGMRVERGSGYGRLDRHTMESLKKWRFEPLPGTGAQWGVITFRFVTE